MTIEQDLAELRAWAQQVRAALDGRELPDLPDQTPARIKAIRDALLSLPHKDPHLKEAPWNGEISRWAATFPKVYDPECLVCVALKPAVPVP